MMDTILRRTLLTVTMTVFCGVVFHAPISVWLGTVFPEDNLFIKSWKELLTLFALLLLSIQVWYRHWWKKLFKDWVIRLAALYCLVHLALLPFFWQGALPAVAGLMIDLRFVAFFVVVYVSLRLYPQWRRPLLIGGAVSAAISLLFVLLQVTVLPHDVLKHIGYDKQTTIAPYMTVDENYDYIRVNGTLRGPNPLGAYAVIVLAVSVSMMTMARRQLQKVHRYMPWFMGALAILSLVAIWFSYSRSALAVGVAVIACIVGAMLWRRSPKVTIAGFGGLLVAGGIAIASQWNTPAVQNVLLHRDPDSTSLVGSNEEHMDSLNEGWQRMVEQPLGAGIGSTGSASLMGDAPIIIENQYLFIAHEVGWVGVIVFIGLFGVVMVRLYKGRQNPLVFGVLVSGAGLALIGILLPVWADDTVSMVWWGLAAVAIVPITNKKKGVHHG